MTWYLWIIAILVLMILLFIPFTSYMIARNMFHPSRLSLLETRNAENQKSPGLMDEYDSWDIASYQIESRDGFSLQVYDVEPIEPTLDFVVMAHRYSYSHHGVVKYANIMRNMGYHVVMFDERFHGKSGGNFCSMGGLEQYDLYDVISDVYTRYGNDIFLGTYGESMGAATALLEQRNDSRVRFVGADCPFSDLESITTYLVKKKSHLPKWPFINLADLFFYKATKQHIQDISPLEAVKDTKVPIFYAHGVNDTFILPYHSQILYDATPTLKKLYFGENGARHVEAQRKNPKEYLSSLTEFLIEVKRSYNTDNEVE